MGPSLFDIGKRPHCEGCPLNTPNNFARTKGKGWTGVMILLEALGEEEAKQHIPMVGSAGQFADSLIARLPWKTPLDADAFLWANTINCRPPANKLTNTTYENEALSRCRPYLEEVVERFKPKVIVTMGNQALRAATGYWGIDKWRGYKIPSIFGVPVVATYHPSFIMRGKFGYGWLWIQDLRKALLIADGSYEEGLTHYVLRPSISEAWDFYKECKENGLPISADIETPYSGDEDEDEETGEPKEDPSFEVLRISFSFKERHAITMPFEGEYVEVVRALLALEAPKLFWNMAFDVRRLVAKGCPVKGRIYDVMYLWKLWQPQVRYSLAQAASALTTMPPWKYLSKEEPQHYSCLNRTQSVVLWGGKRRLISDIVNNKEMAVLTGVGKAGEPIPVKVIDWHKYPDTHDWLLISTGGWRERINCTSDHLLMTKELGWLPARDVKPGMQLISPRLGSDSFIHGKILGDGYADPQRQLVFSQANKTYAKRGAEHMATLLHETHNSLSPNPQWRVSTAISAYWKKMFYPKGVKVFIPPTSAEALAIWYCDDGSITNSKGRWSGQAPSIAIPKTWEKAVGEWFAQTFQPNDIRVTHNGRVGSQGSLVRLVGISKFDFFDRIASYVPPEMYYKLPEPWRGKYNGWLEKPVFQWQEIQYVKPAKHQSPRFDVTIDHPSHAFFTPGGLVHNCCDSDAPVRIWNILEPKVKALGLWDMYERHFVDLLGELEKISLTGVPVNRELRKQTRASLALREEKLVEELTEIVPPAIRSYHPKKGFKKTEAQLRKTKSWIEGKMVELELGVTDVEFDKIQAKATKEELRKQAKDAKKALPKRKRKTPKGEASNSGGDL